jgi:enolase-phosphatase E1
MIAAVVIDIEGTVSPTRAVRGDLYDYTRQRLPRWLVENRGDAAASVIAQTRELAGRPDAEVADVGEILCGWLDSDLKAEPLKTAQGLICGQGFRDGDLHGEFFTDAAPALRAWRAAGVGLYVYSSGSVRNQQDWFAHARGGELASLIDGWFDLSTAGDKRETSSYVRIADSIGLPPNKILFLSDHPDELDSAANAEFLVVGVTRPGEPNSPRPPHRWVTSLADVDARRL